MSIQLAPLPADRFDEWRAAAEARLVERSRRSGYRVGADAVEYAARVFAEVLPEGVDSPAARVLVITEGARELGTLWLALAGEKLFVLELAVEDVFPADELFAEIVVIARQQGATRLSAGLFPQDEAGHALIAGRGFTLASIQMVLEPLPERAAEDDVVVSPMTAERFPGYAEASEAAFAGDLVDSGRYTPEEAVAESHRQMQLELPDGLDSAGQSFFTASVDGVEVGVLWIGARLRDDRPHAFVLDIEVAADQRRRGYGRALMLAVEREARAFGADSVGLHVFGFNTGAIELYERLGYRRVEESYFLDL